jgi:hypothetical protein
MTANISFWCEWSHPVGRVGAVVGRPGKSSSARWSPGAAGGLRDQRGVVAGAPSRAADVREAEGLVRAGG